MMFRGAFVSLISGIVPAAEHNNREANILQANSLFMMIRLREWADCSAGRGPMTSQPR